MPQSDHNTALEGTIIGDTYRVGRRIGEGAMGAVFEATHLRLAGRYAIKVLQADIASQPEVLARFQREAAITSQLRHPNIISVLDFNLTPDGRPFLAMELLEGTELSHEIRRSAPMPLERTLDIVAQVTSALSAAHALGIVHRDLKPQNLFLLQMPGNQRQLVKVLDFGISKVHEATTLLTQANVVIGTPQYMAPEQALGQGAAIDQRVDQFALGSITYELLTGRAAFLGDSIPSVLYQVVHEQPPAIRSLNPQVPAPVEAAIMRALAKKADDRFADVQEFYAALAQEEQVRVEKPRRALPSEITVRGPAPAMVLVPGARDRGAETTFTTATAELGHEALSVIRPRRTQAVAAGLLGLVAVIAGGWFFAVSQRQTAAPPQTAGVEKPTSSPPPASAPASAEPLAGNAPVQILNPPPGLTVTVDDQPAGLPLSLRRVERSYSLGFLAPGYQPQTIVVQGNQAKHQVRLDLALVPSAIAPAVVPAAPVATGEAKPSAAAPARPRGRPRPSEDGVPDPSAPAPTVPPPREPTRLIRDSGTRVAPARSANPAHAGEACAAQSYHHGLLNQERAHARNVPEQERPRCSPRRRGWMGPGRDCVRVALSRGLPAGGQRDRGGGR